MVEERVVERECFATSSGDIKEYILAKQNILSCFLLVGVEEEFAKLWQPWQDPVPSQDDIP